ncbi:unnamed protein product [Trypanosoma congolense IL3000]|uniref:WGS project CAEQ00000000 data, annotated contig 369 n=1 Tax=Trypanosoma congolense (strain IL3000) TaxID=1068625 RepID=F9WFC1_TRYCI|nr:unnamed protein product [Trypanosoma congolense IL3000]
MAGVLRHYTCEAAPKTLPPSHGAQQSKGPYDALQPACGGFGATSSESILRTRGMFSDVSRAICTRRDWLSPSGITSNLLVSSNAAATPTAWQTTPNGAVLKGSCICSEACSDLPSTHALNHRMVCKNNTKTGRGIQQRQENKRGADIDMLPYKYPKPSNCEK